MIISSAIRGSTLRASSTVLSFTSFFDVEGSISQADINGVAASVFTTLKHVAPQSLVEVQQMGENAFASMFVIAFCQAMLALFQFRTNPKGSLLVPPGSTEGMVEPTHVQVQCQHCEEEKVEPWFSALKDLESSIETMRENGMTSILPNQKGETSPLAKRMNKALILLMPWASNVFSFLIQRNIHLFHLGFFLSLSQLFDLPDRLFPTDRPSPSIDSSATQIPNHDDPAPIQRIIVLGDSLAAGVGTVDVFEQEIGQENEEQQKQQLRVGPGPVFPRVLAQKISENCGQPVHWRSAGVVGGDTKEIAEHCLDVVRDEVESGRPPDLVMIICGVNDLKKFAINPIRNAGPKAFRSRMIDLVTQIRNLCPGTKVVLPSMPTQMFRRDSPLNIFPLVFFLNTVVGLWDSQKKLVANKFPKGQVSYMGLDPEEVYDWYMSDPSKYGLPPDLNGDGTDDTALIARDGVHPNARCYAFWGASLANKLTLGQQRRKDLVSDLQRDGPLLDDVEHRLHATKESRS